MNAQLNADIEWIPPDRNLSLFLSDLDHATNEPPRGKTNNVVSEQVLHKSGCTVTEAG